MSLAQILEKKASEGDDIESSYLKRLYHIPHAQLEAEKTSLHTKLDSTLRSQRSLAGDHGKDFVSSRSAMDRLSVVAKSLRQSSNKAVETSLAAPRVPERAYTALQAVLRDDAATYRQIDKLQELLSLPEMIKDYVFAGNYSTAIDLASMAERLQKRYPQSALISHLVSEVQTSVDGMREIFLDALKESSRLPSLTRSVTFLQRLNFANLEMLFIDSRWEFLQEQWKQIPPQLQQTQPYMFLKRVAEIYREHVFATINGYNTIFHSSEKEISTAGRVRLALFSRQSLQALLGFLREHAPRIKDQSDRASLWLQLAFCANSLGRIGADFWPFLDSTILTREEWQEASQHQSDMAGRVTKYGSSPVPLESK